MQKGRQLATFFNTLNKFLTTYQAGAAAGAGGGLACHSPDAK